MVDAAIASLELLLCVALRRNYLHLYQRYTMPRKPNPAAPFHCDRPMHSNGDRWRCANPDCRKQIAKSGRKPGEHHKHGAIGGTSGAERMQKSRAKKKSEDGA